MKHKLPIAALATIAVILTAEFFFIRQTEPLTGLPFLQPTADDAVIAAKHSMMDLADKTFTIVGDSSAMHGLHPATLNEFTGQHFLNLGTLASMTVAGYCEFGMEILNGEHKPSALMLAVLPQTLEIDERQANEMGQLGRYLIAYDDSPGSTYSASPREHLDWFTKKHRFNIFPPEFGGSYEDFHRSLLDTDGFLVERKEHVKHTRVLDHFRPSDLSRSALEALIETAQRQNTPLYLILSPKPRTLANAEYEADSKDFLAKLKQKFPQIHIIQKNAPRWDEKYFSTETHLNFEGAVRFSKIIAERIASRASSQGVQSP
jgi:hypothetical protein